MALRTRLLIAGLIGVHALICVSLAVWVWLTHRFEIPQEYAFQVHFFLQGLAIGQANLLAFWAVFAPGSIIWRWSSAAFLTALSWFLIVGMEDLLFDPEITINSEWSTAAIVFQIPALMLPMMALRYARKLRYLPPEQSPEQSSGLQISLRELLLSIAVVGPTLVMLRELNAVESLTSLIRMLGPRLLAILLATNLLATLPCMWVTTSQRFPPLQWMAVLPIVTFPIWQAEIAALHLEIYNMQPDFTWNMLTSNLAQGLSACVTLAILRWHGFRWVSQRGLLTS